MLSVRDITLTNCHLPDEYIDPAISFGADIETIEIQALPSAKDILTSIVPFHWLRINKDETEETSHATNTLNECHLPEEYVDVPVLCYYEDGSDMSESEQLPSAKDLLSYILQLAFVVAVVAILLISSLVALWYTPHKIKAIVPAPLPEARPVEEETQNDTIIMASVVASV